MEFLRIERPSTTAELVLARPPVNALHSGLLREIADAVAALDGDDSVRGVLLRGEGKCLSAGLDLAEVASLDERGALEFFATFDSAFNALFGIGKPLAVAVDGHAIAGGLILALCGDFVAIGRGPHKLGLTELTVGVPFPRSALEIARAALPQRALRVLVNGAVALPAAEAFELGVGDVLCDDARANARTWLESVASRPLEAFRFVKRMMREPALQRIAAGPQGEREAHAKILAGGREIITAALQATKR
jgi:enoyl-CoA hydratase